MIRIEIKISTQNGREMSPDQVQKFVEESLHQFQTMLVKDVALHGSFVNFCEPKSEKRSFDFLRQIPVYENSQDPTGRVELCGYSDVPVVLPVPQNIRKKTQFASKKP